ncbi:MauE/DoxX family redox-associated membrane protein [Streptosporangium sp. NPDC051022]|uniref:MauE/DoxX family redox-associated membrane protein n=1 Tax=Streptosporangium sp. NPDC051022 TaxID=3155752 RepID=UPI0034252D9D
MEYVAIGCGVTQAAVFAVAVAGKARGAEAFRAFARSLAETRLVNRRWRTGAAIGMVVAETAAVLLLAVPGAAALGFAVATALCALLTGAVALTVLRRTGASCLCFGARPSRLGWAHVVRNAILTAVCGLGLAAVTAGPAPPPVRAEGLLVAVLAGAAGALTIIRFDDLAYLFQPVDSSDRSVPR